MHDTAAINARRFFDRYRPLMGTRPVIVELGAGSDQTIRAMAPDTDYVSTDMQAIPGVDRVLADPYTMPFETGSVDCVIASSVYEHTEWFWESFVECQRILRPGGFMYIQVPSNGPVHRFPVDCWRFYPDSAQALARYAQHRGRPCRVLHSEITPPLADIWYDYVAVFERSQPDLGTGEETSKT